MLLAIIVAQCCPLLKEAVQSQTQLHIVPFNAGKRSDCLSLWVSMWRFPKSIFGYPISSSIFWCWIFHHTLVLQIPSEEVFTPQKTISNTVSGVWSCRDKTIQLVLVSQWRKLMEIRCPFPKVATDLHRWAWHHSRRSVQRRGRFAKRSRSEGKHLWINYGKFNNFNDTIIIDLVYGI